MSRYVNNQLALLENLNRVFLGVHCSGDFDGGRGWGHSCNQDSRVAVTRADFVDELFYRLYSEVGFAVELYIDAAELRFWVCVSRGRWLAEFMYHVDGWFEGEAEAAASEVGKYVSSTTGLLRLV